MAAWELWAPRRQLVIGRKARWANNLGIFVIDALAVRLLIPTAAVGAAVLASDRGIEYVSCAIWPAAPREPATRAVTVSTTFSRAGRGDAIPAF